MAENETGAEEASETGGKKKIIIIAAALVLLLGLGAGGYFLFLSPEPSEVSAEVDEPPKLEKVYHYYELPEQIINLERGDGYANYLKIRISLELDNENQIPIITQLEPRIQDVFQTYMRALRVSDLNGSAAVFRLRRSLLKRLNLVTEPVQVHDLLFKEILVQ